LKLQTVVFGRGGMRASDNVIWIKKMFDKVEPDIVITLLGINDLAWNGGKGYKYQSVTELFQKENKDTVKKKYCREYSQICRRVVRIKRALKEKEKLKTGATVEWHSANLPNLRKKYQNYPYVQNPIRNPDPIHEFRDAVSWLIKYFRKNEVSVILLGQPVLWKESFLPSEFKRLWFPINTPNGRVRPSGAWLKREMAKYNSVQEELAHSIDGVIYLGLDDKIPKSLDYYFDDCHYTDLGSRAVADHILPVLIKVVNNFIFKKNI
ncbi:MAG: hypothetical protein OET79_16090, partial [Nitrospirota bacterium]|nr:hypothetical protein [Nitrospirota bacterium]